MQDLINITLEISHKVRKTEKYHVILVVTISSLESRFPFIIFSYPYFIISICEIKLCETFNLI